MIAEDQNKALLILAHATQKREEWREYAAYCLNREKGLRKDAFKHLDNFIKATKKKTLTDRIEFVSFIFPYFEKVAETDYGGFPQPLKKLLIEPTLLEWCTVEEKNSDPFRWYGKYYRSEVHLLKALALNPKDDKARSTLISWWSYAIYHAVHHLPDYYIGDPHEDIALSKKIKGQIDLLVDPKIRKSWEEELEDDLKLVRNYILWKESGHTNFKKWGEEKQIETGYGIDRAYYYDE